MNQRPSENSEHRTRASLLIRLRDSTDDDAWAEFHDLYAPLLYNYARARGLNHSDAEDIRSECYEALVRQLKDFEYDRGRGSFKAWLRTMVTRRVIDRLRKQREQRADSRVLRELKDDDSENEEIWSLEWKRQHLRYCVEQVRPLVSDSVWQAFHMLAEKDAPVPAVCAALNMNANQVYKARARMLALIREKMQYLQLHEE